MARKDFASILTNSARFQLWSIVPTAIAAALAAFAGTQIEHSTEHQTIWLSIGGAVGGFVVNCLGLISFTGLRAPYKQRNEVRATLTSLTLETITAVSARALDGGVVIDVTNAGPTDTFEAQIDSLSPGLRFDRGWSVNYPIQLPWGSPYEAIGANLSERRSRRLLTGGTGSVWLVGLWPLQENPPHNLLGVYDTSQHEGYFFARGSYDPAPGFVVSVAVLREHGAPLTRRYFTMCSERRFAVLELPNEGESPVGRAANILSAKTVRDDGAWSDRNLLEVLFTDRDTWVEWAPRNGFRGQIFEGFILAGVLEHGRATGYDLRGHPYDFDRYRVNNVGHDLIRLLESSSHSSDHGSSTS